MDMAPKLQDFLASHQAAYDVLEHSSTPTTNAAAQAAHVPGERVAKAVLVKDGAGYLLAVLPANQHIGLHRLAAKLHCDSLRLASEAEAGALFTDCALGALPAVGEAYGMRSVIEEELDRQPEVFLEAGDHRHLVHLTRWEFARLTGRVPRAHFSSDESRIPGGDA